MSGRAEQVIALFGNELAADSLTFVVNSKYLTSPSGGYAFLLDSNLRPLKASDGKWLLVRAVYPDWRTFTPGAPLDLYNQQGGQIIGRFYVQNVRQVSRKFVEFTCTDCVGMIDAIADHNGGIYNGTPIGDIIDDIMSGSGIAYTVTQEVREVAAYGRLPRDNRRTNLGRVLVATGATLTEDTAGRMVVSYLGAGNVQNIPQRVIYLNTGSVEYRHPATAVQVTEHAFYQLADDEQKTLFDNTAEITTAVPQTVIFEEPCYNLTTTGTLAIVESNENFAIVEGNGTLVGTVYTHTRRVITESTGVVAAENVLTLEDNELVGIHNSDYVAKRMANYYKLAIGVQFEAHDESGALQPGTKLNIVDPFGVSRVGWLEKKTFNLGNKTRAQMDIAIDWQPGPWGSTFDEYELITEDDPAWEVPAGVTTVRVILGQGGQGGGGGYDGGASDCDDGGDGGWAGEAGNAGKVYVVDVPVTAGQTFAITIGAAGTGGAPNVTGTEGGESTFGSYSSASGTIPENGFLNQFLGETYALAGIDGIAGGKGGGTSSQEFVYGESVTADGQTWTGGRSVPPTNRYNGAGGGGAAYGNNGANASNEALGGAGADATDRPNLPTPGLGCGGIGGNGGGGGGKAGAQWSSNLQTWICWGNYARGGNGTAGHDGGQGWCLLLYKRAS